MPHLQTPDAVVRELLAATDAKDTAAVARLLTDDVRVRFGNAEPVHGKAALFDGDDQFLDSIAGLRQEIHDLWTVADDVVLAEMTVHYERLDGGRVSLPCVDTFRLRDGLVHDYRIYIDLSLLFA